MVLRKTLYRRPARLIREVKLSPHDTPHYDMSHGSEHTSTKSTKKGKVPPPEARFTTVLADANRKPYKSEDAQRSEK